MDNSSCPHCTDRAFRVKLLLAWGGVLGGAASLVAASTALAQVFMG
ncbi:hypothetical protein [Actinoplanes friuliensis]|nr:hypothetical protein [Actinoplanes friuliensis]